MADSDTAGRDIRRAIKTFLTPGVKQFDLFIAEFRKHCVSDVACMKVGLNPKIVQEHYDEGKSVLVNRERMTELEYIKNLDDNTLLAALTNKTEEPIKNADKQDIFNLRLAYLWDQAVADKVTELLNIQNSALTEKPFEGMDKMPAAYVRSVCP